MRRRLVSPMVIALVALSIPAHLLAQGPSPSSISKPTLTIARFEGGRTNDKSDPGAEFADAIAVRIEESGCCRVMPREFLGAAPEHKPASITAVRQAAAAAGVEYVVLGSVTQTSRRPTYPTMALPMGRRPTTPFGFHGGAPTMAYSAPITTLVTVDLRVLDVVTGETARTLRVERTVNARTNSTYRAPAPVPGRGVIGTVLGVAAMSARPRQPVDSVLTSLTPDVADALVRVASQLTRER